MGGTARIVIDGVARCMSRRLINRADPIILAVLVAALLLLAGTTWDQLRQVRATRARLRDAGAIIGTLTDVDLAMRDAEAGQRGFLLTGRDAELAPYLAAARQVPVLLAQLQVEADADPAAQAESRALSPPLRQRLDALARSVRLRADGQPEAAVALALTDAAPVPGEAEGRLRAMILADTRLRAERTAATDGRVAQTRELMVGVPMLALLALLWAARMLNRAWTDASRIEAGQRTIAVQLRTSLDSLSQGVAVFDADHALSSWNACFQALLDLPASLVVVGMPYAAFSGYAVAGEPPLLEPAEQIRREPPRTGEPAVYERVRAGGDHLELRRSPTPDGGFVLTISDMTKRAQAEAVLREAQKMQAIGQLTGGIAHDFNNLLTVILGNLELARGRLSADPAMRARIERATWAAQRGAALTAQLLAVARKQPLAPASIDLAGSMPELVPLLRRTLGADIEIGYVADEGLWPALADPAQLENAVLNLALNARDAMPDGGRLTIEMRNQVLDGRYAAAHHEVAAGDYAMLAVSDTGHGMPPAVLARVFEPFFTTKPDGKGTGLGLPMVFGFVKQSGGHVKITSEVGRGTTVRLYLPRAAAAAPVPRPIAGAASAPRGSATILVVEDEPAVREVAVAILEGLGYQVLEAEDGKAALRLIAAHGREIALMLTDVVLPGQLRGRELTRQAVLACPGLKVLYMSGYTENAIMQDGRLDEGVNLIGKPFQREELARRVAHLLAGNTLGDAKRDGVVRDAPDAGLAHNRAIPLLVNDAASNRA